MKYILSFFALLSLAANAQIIYTDIVPDTVLSGTIDIFEGDEYTVDMDNDGNGDYELRQIDAGSYKFAHVNSDGGGEPTLTPLSNEVVSDAGAPRKVHALNFGDPISAAQPWELVGGGDLEMATIGFVPSGHWIGVTEAFVGVRFDSSGTTYYGWIRVELGPGSAPMTIKDYAYNASGGSISAGEMPVPPCNAPTLLTATNIMATSLDLAWQENNSATQWQIEYGVSGFTPGTGTFIITSTNPHNLTGLTANTDYDYYVRSICGVGDTSAWSSSYTFTTAIPPCLVPTALGATSITPTTADLGWTDNNGSTSWSVEYGLSGFAIGTGIIEFATTNPHNVTGLTPDTWYDYYVRSYCSFGDSSNYSAVDSFKTLIDDSGLDDNIFDFYVVPNPSHGIFKVMHGTAPIITIEVYNTLGQQVFSLNGASHELIIDLSDEEKGVYIITVETSLGRTSQRLVIE